MNDNSLTTDSLSSPPDSTLSRIVGVIVSPAKTLERIVQNPTWLVPLILVVLGSMIAGYFLSPLIIQMQREQIMAQNPNFTEQQLEMTATITKYSTLFAPLLFVPIMYAIIAAVFLFTGNIILGGEARFKTLFSVVCWSGIVSLVVSAITVPAMTFAGKMESPTSLAFLAAEGSEKSALYIFLSQIDLLTLWWVVVMGLGVAAAYRFTSQKGIGIAVVWWLVMVAIGTGFRAIFS